MSVKKKDRHLAKNDSLNHTRKLINQVLILTRPYQKFPDGTCIKPGILGNPQYFQMFGANIVKYSKLIHTNVYLGIKTKLKNKESLEKRKEYFTNALNYCDIVLQDLDLCIYNYAQNNKKKKKSFEYVANLTYTVKKSLKDRINRDKILYDRYYSNK